MNKSKFKTVLSFLFATIAVTSYLLSKPSIEEIAVSSTKENDVRVITIVKDASNTLIPVSFSMDENTSLDQRLNSSLTKLIKGSYDSEQYSALLPSSTVILSSEIQDGKVTINFNEEFLKYDPNDEIQILEAIASLCRQFDAQDIDLKINGENLNFMPAHHTPIPEIFDSSIGINNFESFTQWIHDSEGITVFYCKKENEETIYVPKTIRVSRNQSSNEKLEIISKELSAQNHLSQPLFTNCVTVVSLMEQNDITVIECSKNIVEENKIIDEAMMCFMLTLSTMNFDKNTVIKVDGVVLSSLSDYLANNSFNNFDFLFN